MPVFEGVNLNPALLQEGNVASDIASAAGDFFNAYLAMDQNKRQREQHATAQLEEYARPVSIAVDKQPSIQAPPEARAGGIPPLSDEMLASFSTSSGLPKPGEKQPAIPDAAPPSVPIDLEPLQGQTDIMTLGPQVKQGIMAEFGRNPRGIRDVLAQQARFSAAEVAMAQRGEYSPEMTEKLANVPGGQLTGLPGTKTREFAMMRFIEVPREKTKARMDELDKKLAAKAGSDQAKNILKAYDLALKSEAAATQRAFVNKLINEGFKGTPESMLQGLQKSVLPVWEGTARGAGLALNSDPMRQVIATDMQRMADEAQTPEEKNKIFEFFNTQVWPNMNRLVGGSDTSEKKPAAPKAPPVDPAVRRKERIDVAKRLISEGVETRASAVAKLRKVYPDFKESELR